MFDELIRTASRDLQRGEGEPSTGIAGGGNLDQPEHMTRDRDRERLEEYEGIYAGGGPVAQLIDIRAFMIFGVGTEFVTHDDEITQAVPWADEPVTVAEWLEHELPNRDNLLVNLGRDAYVYGDWLTETVETRGGQLDRIVTINPKTMEPRFDDAGTIRRWEQIMDRGPLEGETVERFDPEEIGHGALLRLGRNPLGISLIGRAMDEIERLQSNQRAISEALEKHAFTRWHVQVNAQVDDNDLRRVRQRFHEVSEYRELLTGRDIDIEPLDEGGVGESITDITENDLRNLAATLGVPEEMAGLGRGSTEATAKVRLQSFERTGRGEQRDMASQFIREVVRDVIANHSPFSRDIDIGLEFGDIVSDQQATAEWLRDFKDTFTRDELRERLDAGPVPEEADMDGDEPPQSEDGGGGGGGIFDDVGGGLSRERGTGNRTRTLTSDGHEPWEETWHDLVEHALWSDATDRQLFEFDPAEVPAFVIENLRQAIDDSLFADFETVPDGARMQVRETMLDSLDERHGWSIDSIMTNLQDELPNLSTQEAEVIARSETQAVVSEAREQSYRDRLDMDAARFKWQGPSDTRTTDACEWIKSQIDDSEGVSMDRLKELIQEAPRHDDSLDADMAREWASHPQCRHQPIRVVG